MTIADAPRSEVGYPGGMAPAYTAGLGRGFTVENLDLNVDLRFPASAVVYDRMGREDGQVVSAIRAIVQAVVGARRQLKGDDVRPEVMQLVRTNLGLEDTDGGRQRRRRRGIVYRDHVRQAVTGMLRYGFMPFEPVYEVGPAAPGQEDPADPRRLYAHLRKLGPRNPRTLMEVRVAEDGGLAGIVQQPPPGQVNPFGVFIPVERLVMYVNEQEGADWTGTSALRAAYKHWVIKDALIRVGAQVVERNGMGIPVVDYADPSLEGKALRLSRAFRAGSEAGAALERGKMGLTVVGVSGNTVDGLPWVKYHDEAMGRSLLAMVLNLGHDNGARALGQTFADLLAAYINSIADSLDEVDTEHVIRDLVELNYGPDEPYPVLETEDVAAESTPTAEALKALADAGLLTPDAGLEGDIRRRYTLPAKPAPVGDQAVEDAAGSPVAQVGIPALIDAGVISPDEGRQMLKLPGQAPGLPVPADAVPSSADVVDLPVPMASALSEHRDAIRVTLGLSSGDPIVDRLAEVTAKVAALRAGHRVTA